MSEEPARPPSLDQLVEVHQALWWFLEACQGALQPNIEQEKEVLPRFLGMADALAPIRPRLDSIAGWPTRIKRALRSIVNAFDQTSRLWGWDWVTKPEPERSAYLDDRRASKDSALDQPILEAALFLSDTWEGSGQCPYDNLADEARTRGIVARTMTADEACAQYREAKARYNSELRYGRCYPKLAETEYKTLVEAKNALRGELTTLAPDQIERPPWQEQPESVSPAPREGIDAITIPENPAQWPSLLAWLNVQIRLTTIENDPRIKMQLAQNLMPTRVYSLQPLLDAKNKLIGMMAANKEKQGIETPPQPSVPPTGEARPSEIPAELLDRVTLDQAAAAVNRKKRTLERRKTKGTLPPPTVEGGGGKPDLWDWSVIRPWLQEEFDVILPERFFANVR